MEQVHPHSFLLCLRRKTRSAQRKESRSFCREEFHTFQKAPLKRLSGVFRVRSLLQQTLHPKSLRVSVPPSPPCLAPQAPPSRANPCLIRIRSSPRQARGGRRPTPSRDAAGAMPPLFRGRSEQTFPTGIPAGIPAGNSSEKRIAFWKAIWQHACTIYVRGRLAQLVRALA